VVLRCMSAGHGNFFDHTATVTFYEWEVRVRKEGYAHVGPVELARFAGPGSHIKDLPPAPIRIELKQAQGGRGQGPEKPPHE